MSSAIIGLFPGVALCTDINLVWDANNETDLVGYLVYYGTTSGNYTHRIDVGNISQHTFIDLQDGVTYYIAVTAYDVNGNESDYSVELSHPVGVLNSPSIPAAPNSSYIDNGDPGTSFTGVWRLSTGPDYYGNQSVYSRAAGATYTYQTAANGDHEVSVWWTQLPSRDTSVPVRIYDGNTLLDTVWINQQQDGGQWNYLGTYNFGGTARVVITSETTGFSTCADAVLFGP
jgi:hypothetical protein